MSVDTTLLDCCAMCHKVLTLYSASVRTVKRTVYIVHVQWPLPDTEKLSRE